ncbi:MAG: metallophosphoesterase [Polyangiaceae bacterium]
MPRLHILSDVHLEFAPFTFSDVGADVLVLAGDIGVGKQGVEAALGRDGRLPVVYVLGNHELYGHDFDSLPRELATLGKPGEVHVLDNAECVLAGVRFLGSTLWTDFLVSPNFTDNVEFARFGMSDYARIRSGAGKLTPERTAERFRQSRDWLAARLADPFDGPTVVVTHHGPSRRSWPAWLRHDELMASCVSDLEDLMAASAASLWIHGHTHWCVDYVVGRTRVVSNQLGYPNQRVPGFDPRFTVDLDGG